MKNILMLIIVLGLLVSGCATYKNMALDEVTLKEKENMTVEEATQYCKANVRNRSVAVGFIPLVGGAFQERTLSEWPVYFGRCMKELGFERKETVSPPIVYYWRKKVTTTETEPLPKR